MEQKSRSSPDELYEQNVGSDKNHIYNDTLSDENTKLREELQTLQNEYDEFVYIASHDLASPLRTTISFCELLENDIANNNTREIERDVAYILDGNQKAQKLLHALLTLSRLKIQTTESVNLNDCINLAVENLKAEIPDFPIKVVTEITKEILADTKLITMLFYEILKNSHQSKSNNVLIRSPNKEQNYYSIKDNGEGISDHLVDKTFVPFRSFFVAETPLLGMGLAYCKKIIRLYKGSISLHSKGRSTGAEVRFTIATDDKK